MSTLIPITWPYWIAGVNTAFWFISVLLLLRNYNLVSQWRDQFLSMRELANNRRHTIEVGRARLTRALAAIKEIGFLTKGTELESKVKEICLEAAKIPVDTEVEKI